MLVRNPDRVDEVFLYFFELVLFSYVTAAVIIKAIHRILMVRFSFQDIFFSPLWIFVLALGSLFFAYLFEIERLNEISSVQNISFVSYTFITCAC